MNFFSWNGRAQISAVVRTSFDVVSLFTNFIPLSANPTKWSNILKQFVGNLPTNCLSVFDHFVNLALKGLRNFVTTEQRVELQHSRKCMVDIHLYGNIESMCNMRQSIQKWTSKICKRQPLKNLYIDIWSV